MALNRYTLTATVTVPAGTATADANGFGLVTYAGPAGAWAEGYPVTFLKGQVITLDPAAALFAAIGSGNLAAFRDGTDAVGHASISN